MARPGVTAGVFAGLALRFSAWQNVCLCLALCASGGSGTAWLACVPYVSNEVSDDLSISLPTTLALRPETSNWSAGFRLTSPAREWKLRLVSDDAYGTTAPLVSLKRTVGDEARGSRPPNVFALGNWTEMKVEVTPEKALLIELTRGDKVHSVTDALGSICGNVSLHVEHLSRVVLSRDCPAHCIAEKVMSGDSSKTTKYLERKRNTLHVLNRITYDLSVALVYIDCVKNEKKTDFKHFGEDSLFLKPRVWNKITISYIREEHHGVSITINGNLTLDSLWKIRRFGCHHFVRFEIQTSDIAFRSFGCSDTYYQTTQDDSPRGPLTCSAETTRPREDQTTEAPSSPPQTTSTHEASSFSTPTPEAHTRRSHDREDLIHLSSLLAMVVVEVLLGVYSLVLTFANKAMSI